MSAIEIQYVEACPGWRGAQGREQQVVVEAGLQDLVVINAVSVETEHDAHARRFMRSHAVRIAGRDLDPDAHELTWCGLRHRLYVHEGRPQGLPLVSWVLSALRVAESAVADAPCCGGGQ